MTGQMVAEASVVIIGAGPAGLCTSYELKKRGVEAVILEAGKQPGWSWANMAENISVLSPWKRNVMNGTSWNIFNMHHQPPVQEYQLYLMDYAEQNGLNVLCDTPVNRIEKSGTGFLIHTGKGSIASQTVINATGYFFNPVLPVFDGHDDDQLPMIHSQAFKSAEKLKSAHPEVRDILVIGGRVSAGQTATELELSGLFTVDLCLRTPLRFSRDPWLQKLVFSVYYLVEDHWAKTNPQKLAETNPPMEGGVTRKLIQKGCIGQRPGIDCISGTTVHFIDGSHKDYDMMIACTGYGPVARHLSGLADAVDDVLPDAGHMESAAVPGLYFVGLDKLRTFRSRYLRGIREDAVVLAEHIVERHSL